MKSINQNSEVLKTFLKIGLGFGVVFYVLRSKMVDFQSLGVVLFDPANLLIAVLFLSFTVTCCLFRWFILVRALGLSPSLKDLWILTMMGNFFNTFMPGSVGGDLIKAWYVAGHEPTRKTKAVFTVLLDRVVGLSVFAFYASLTLVLYSHWLENNPQLQALGTAIWSFTVFSAFASLVFFNSKLWAMAPVQSVMTFLHRFKTLAKILDAILSYRGHLKVILAALFLSGVSITGFVIMYSILGAKLGIDISLGHYFFIVPIGLVASAIPLLPGGIGVGQVAFFKLFQWVGIANPEQGGALCTLLQIYVILFNSSGLFFYIRYKKKPSLKTESQSSNTSSSPEELTSKRLTGSFSTS